MFTLLQRLAATQAEIETDRTADGLQQRLARIERYVGYLVDQLDHALEVFAAFSQTFGQCLALEHNRARCGRQQAGDDTCQRGLAGARLAHYGHCFATAYIKTHVAHHLERPIRSVDVVELQNRVWLDRQLVGAFTVRRTAHCHQARRVVLRGCLQHAVHRALFHFFAVAQHLDAVRHLGHHRQVVGDVQRGRAVLADQRLEQDQNLDLRCHVERRSGLVQHQDVGAAGHRHRGHRALQLSAGCLVRVTRAKGLRLGQVERLEQVAGPGFGLFAFHQTVYQWRFTHLVHDGMRGVERGRRGLRYVGDAAATHRTATGGIELADVNAVDLDRAARDMHPRARIRHRGQADGGLAGTAFADQAQHFAGMQRNAHVVDDDRAAAHRFQAQPLDLQNDFFVGHGRHLTVQPGRRRDAIRWTTTSRPPGSRRR